MDWQLAREWRSRPESRLRRLLRKLPGSKVYPRPAHKAWKLGRWSLLAAGIAWLFPVLLLCAQVALHSNDGYFQEAPHHSTDWLVARVGQPARVVRYNRAYRIWCYPRGSYQVEVAVNERNQVCGVGYGRL